MAAPPCPGSPWRSVAGPRYHLDVELLPALNTHSSLKLRGRIPRHPPTTPSLPRPPTTLSLLPPSPANCWDTGKATVTCGRRPKHWAPLPKLEGQPRGLSAWTEDTRIHTPGLKLPGASPGPRGAASREGVTTFQTLGGSRSRMSPAACCPQPQPLPRCAHRPLLTGFPRPSETWPPCSQPSLSAGEEAGPLLVTPACAARGRERGGRRKRGPHGPLPQLREETSASPPHSQAVTRASLEPSAGCHIPFTKDTAQTDGRPGWEANAPWAWNHSERRRTAGTKARRHVAQGDRPPHSAPSRTQALAPVAAAWAGLPAPWLVPPLPTPPTGRKP